MDLPEIRFFYWCSFGFGEVEVIANGTGTGILVIDKNTDDEIDFILLSESDRNNISERVRDWAIHYEIMRNDPHPANDHFGKNYVDQLNRNMGK